MNSKAVCSYGNSAGAHLALLLNELTTVVPGDVTTQLASYSPKTQCAVDQFGPTDLPKLYAENPRLTKDIAALLGGQTPSSAPAAYSAASPVDQIGTATGPVVIVQGSSDTTVPPDQSTELKQALDTSHIPEQYISYTGGHQYQGATPAVRATILQKIIYFLQKSDQ